MRGVLTKLGARRLRNPPHREPATVLGEGVLPWCRATVAEESGLCCNHGDNVQTRRALWDASVGARCPVRRIRGTRDGEVDGAADQHLACPVELVLAVSRHRCSSPSALSRGIL